MAAKVALSSCFCTRLPLPSKSSSPSSLTHTPTSPKKRAHHFSIHAKLGGGDGEIKQGGKKKFITREEEPEQYWQTAGEREGENPMKTPLPYIIIFGMSTPFVILAIAFANGWVKVPVRWCDYTNLIWLVNPPSAISCISIYFYRSALNFHVMSFAIVLLIQHNKLIMPCSTKKGRGQRKRIIRKGD